MSEATLIHITTLRSVSCWCGLPFAIPSDLHTQAVTMGKQEIYCPLGHRCKWGGNELMQAKNDLLRERASHDQTKANRDYYRRESETNEARRRAEKAAKTRLKNRVGRGVCPCCNRTFQDLQRHMATKHPDFTQTADAEETA